MVNDLDRTLAALADPTRRRVIDLLRESPRRAGELAANCAVSSPAMSRHLRVLRSSGIVEVEADTVEQDARLRVYRLRREPFEELHSWLNRVEAFWTEQMDSFKAYTEARQADGKKAGDQNTEEKGKGRKER